MTELDRVLAVYERELADQPQLQTLADRLPVANQHGVIDHLALNELRRLLTGEQ